MSGSVAKVSQVSRDLDQSKAKNDGPFVRPYGCAGVESNFLLEWNFLLVPREAVGFQN